MKRQDLLYACHFSEYNTVVEARKAAKIIVECVKIIKRGGSDV